MRVALQNTTNVTFSIACVLVPSAPRGLCGVGSYAVDADAEVYVSNLVGVILLCDSLENFW